MHLKVAWGNLGSLVTAITNCSPEERRKMVDARQDLLHPLLAQRTNSLYLVGLLLVVFSSRGLCPCPHTTCSCGGWSSRGVKFRGATGFRSPGGCQLLTPYKIYAGGIDVQLLPPNRGSNFRSRRQLDIRNGFTESPVQIQHLQ